MPAASQAGANQGKRAKEEEPVMFVQTVTISLFALLLGFVLCFAGFRVFVILLPVWALFAGFLATAQVIQELFGGGFLATTSGWVFGFAVGVVCALLAYFYYYAAVLIVAGSAGFELGVGILSGLGVSAGFLLFLVGLIVAAAMVAAVILLNLPKVLLVTLTAGVGASLILTGMLLALGQLSLTSLRWGTIGDLIHASWFWSLVFLVIAGAGIATQLFFPEEYVPAPHGQKQPAST
jgi:hypothetical protein